MAEPSLLAGRYVLGGEIASGGMGSVHLARLVSTRGFSRIVAIKRLHAHLAKDPELSAMFLDEARLAARVQHPNVVSVLDLTADRDELVLVMEHVLGETVARLLQSTRNRGEQIEPPIVCAIAIGMLHGLHAAHTATDDAGQPLGLIHRDVSPQNVIVGVDGVPRLLDFGVAKAAVRSRQTTRQGQIKGKLAYMAPEQLRDEPLTHQVDIYAASIVLWEMLTATRLFEGDNEAAVVRAALVSPIAAPSARAPHVPPALDAIVLRGLARERTERFASAREMALALEAACDAAKPLEVGAWVEQLAGDALETRRQLLSDTAAPVPVHAASSEPVIGISQLATAPLPTQRRPGRGKWLLAGTVIALVTLVLMVTLRNTTRAPAPHRSSTAAPQRLAPHPPESLPEPRAADPPTQDQPDRQMRAERVKAEPPQAPVRPRPRPAARPAASRACDPPWTRDASGKKTYKRQCL